MRSLRTWSAAIALALGLSGCTVDLDHRISCENVVKLRAGLSSAEVRSLLGEPTETVRRASMGHSVGGPVQKVDLEWFYNGRSTYPHIGLFHELSVEFFEDRLVIALGYRHYHGVFSKHDYPALRIVAATPSEGGLYDLHDDFINTFLCEPSFSLIAARASLAQSPIHEFTNSLIH